MKAMMLCFAAALLAAGCSGNTSSAANTASNATAAPLEAASAAATAATDTTSTAAATTTAVATAAVTAAPAASPQFTDLAGVYGADKIAQLATLNVFDIGGTSFAPNQPVMRREFVRWLFSANNAIQSDDAKKIRTAPSGEAAYFKDLPSSDKDFAAIQGMQDAGISVGFPDKSFQPDVPITREQALAVALGVDCNYNGNWSTAPNQAYSYLPPWKDKAAVSKTYAPIIATCAMNGPTGDVVGRVWGKTAVFRPQAKLTRAEAALTIWQIGTRSAADALAATPSASSSP